MTDALMHAAESLRVHAAEHHLQCEFVTWTRGLELPFCPSHERSLLTLTGTVLTLFFSALVIVRVQLWVNVNQAFAHTLNKLWISRVILIC